MNKKGFTLVELLAVIVILGIVGAIAMAGIGNLAKNTKEEMLDKKITMIEESATLYGEDIKGSIMASSNTKKYDGYPCKTTSVYELVNSNYLSKDNNNTCQRYAGRTSGCIEDPSGNLKYLDYLNIVVYVKNKRVRATVVYGDNASISCR